LIKNIVLGYLSFAKVEATEILIKEDPDPNERLMGQFFAALLNTLNGADSSTIDLILVNSRDWLILYPHGVDLTEPEILEIEAYADQLQEYNTSLIGPGLCSDEPMTPIPTATFTPQASYTSSPGPTVPFHTPTPTKKPGGGKPKPTNPPPPQQPTDTPPPLPLSNTPQPTQVPPTPAQTQPPPTP
jgi:hypothetical protein